MKLLKKQFQKKYGHGKISITFQYPDRFYSGKVSNLNESINYFTMDDYNNFDVYP